MIFEDFELIASDPATSIIENPDKTRAKRVSFKVQLTQAPAGDHAAPIATQYDAGLMRDHITRLEGDAPTYDETMQLGALLSEALFPPPLRELLSSSLSMMTAQGKGLRIRLRLLGAELAKLPWEYLLLNRAGGEASPTDFLALMPNVSIVRHESAHMPQPEIKAALPLTLLAAFASPSGWSRLALGDERKVISDAIGASTRIEPIWRFEKDVTRAGLLAGVPAAHLFHFAGHGDIDMAMTEQPSKVESLGQLIFDDGFGDPDPVSAFDVARDLRAAGVRVAMIGACLSGRHDDMNMWTSVATAMLKADLGAVVAMQHKVRDSSAVTFAGAFYAALAAGLSLDEAVIGGRLAIARTDDVRGWGTPVLYLRARDGQVFPELAADASLDAAREQLRVSVEQTIGVVRGRATGIKVKLLTAGELSVKQRVDVVAADADLTGVDIGATRGGSVPPQHPL